MINLKIWKPLPLPLAQRHLPLVTQPKLTARPPQDAQRPVALVTQVVSVVLQLALPMWAVAHSADPTPSESDEPLAIGIAVLQQRDQRPDRIGRGNRSSVGAIDSELAPSCTARASALARDSLASSSPSSQR